ncbi:unnamed protein product [Lactuca virosa]|uniref:Uncharacterized protein n=1 Tax=Lactuca virosa TaxID=75947 RepID=A0AAU9PG46_9ASTR|nr:unnamed protein product [Lactuca virosa]
MMLCDSKAILSRFGRCKFVSEKIKDKLETLVAVTNKHLIYQVMAQTIKSCLDKLPGSPITQICLKLWSSQIWMIFLFRFQMISLSTYGLSRVVSMVSFGVHALTLRYWYANSQSAKILQIIVFHGNKQ